MHPLKMSPQAASSAPWQPPRDEDLTWFSAPEKLAVNRRPLEFTLEVDAFCFGITRAMESLEFPLTEVRPRLVDGHLFLAVAPSAQAERDITRRLRNIQDLTLRYTKDIKGFWEAQVKPKIEEYNRWMAEFATAARSPVELAEAVRQLRRVRGNQWFNVCRPALAPAAIIQRRLEEAHRQKGRKSAEINALEQAAEDGTGVAREAMGLVDRGRIVLFSSLGQVGTRLATAGSIAEPEDIFWLSWMEVRGALEQGGERHGVVKKRKTDASRWAHAAAPHPRGPELPPGAPRMHLIPEILGLLG